ncbi:MAG: protein-glutamate O-methyltransferase CheR [Deltaproteobacteria bacterium]|nr:protein-glutamate O-methyltransferase CheR [Deltaproteobacteria bacterium]
MEEREIKEIETDLLLEAIVRLYGYDFRNYARASLNRRIQQAVDKTNCATISDLTARIVREPEFFQRVVANFSITVTEMFRDPEFYKVLREQVLPYLATYPFIKVWHAGCATGEEAYSLAIMLEEEGLLERATIYATDFNEDALENARAGIYPLEQMKQYGSNYRQAGGRGSLSEHYHAQYESVIMEAKLRQSITFSRHNLTVDQVFGEMHLVLCRNVLIYFDRTLQGRVLRLFDDSLVNSGFLCLGSRESLRFSDTAAHFVEFVAKGKIYRKRTVP